MNSIFFRQRRNITRKNYFCGLFMILLSLIACTVVAASSGSRLDLTDVDIEDVVVEDDIVWFKLNPAASESLKSLTRDHIGKKLQVYWGDIELRNIVVNATIESGVISVENPSDKLLNKLDLHSKFSD